MCQLRVERAALGVRAEMAGQSELVSRAPQGQRPVLAVLVELLTREAL